MSSKIKSEDDCGSGRDYLQLAQLNNWPVQKNGSYYEIEIDGVVVRFPDSARVMPKETRAAINAALVKAGLIVAAVVSLVVAWVVL
jgi:hypothetical protein